ncbi:riboflavin synthase alpha chain [Jatrophihabitans sp. GAS493]|uniref:riboflavin synthase n=1 Tax=Jatrophihabitans sp. GAS493 TaxID=1907575 RepID=UPI000BB6BC26|nr:riboflavin synthase [Jatrophihabitans sp. GAS493]SOD73734.1 riboflavin synthase alpha chain [Jatrophihabitans sp. GAS493]
MFTGIVEELGEVVDVTANGDSAVLTVRAALLGEIAHGASIAINGVCLTVVGQTPAGDERRLDFDVMAETLKRSVIGSLRVGDKVNLERAVRVDGRLDGHVVQGHVDGTGVVLLRTPGDAWESVRVGLPLDLARYVAEKGSIAVDGVSLTVTAVGDDWFEVGLIPETLRATTLGARAPGDPVNLEVDVLAKYAERLLSARLRPEGQA